MQRLIKVTSFLLLAIWLPATLHCDLEAANIAFLTHDDHHHDHDIPAGEHDDSDFNHSIEHTVYTACAPTLKAPPPADSLSIIFTALLCLVGDDGAASLLEPTSHPPPPDLSVAWQFLTRAAPPARAPSLNT